MKRYLILSVFLLCLSCKKENDSETSSTRDSNLDLETNLSNIYKYKSQSSSYFNVGLQLSFSDSASGYQLLLYGDYDEQGNPKNLHFAQLENTKSDTVFSYVFDDNLMVNAIYFTLKSSQQPLQLVVKFSMSDYGTNWVGFFHRNWNWNVSSGERLDSLVNEFYFSDAGDLIHTQRSWTFPTTDRTHQSFQNRNVYSGSKLGIDPTKVKGVIQGVKVAGGLTAVVIGLTLITPPVLGYAIAAGGALAALDAALPLFYNRLVPSADAAVIKYNNNYPFDRIARNKGDKVAGSASGDLSAHYSNAVLIYNPIIVNGSNGSDIKLNFICSSYNYDFVSNRFQSDCCGPDATTDKSILLTESKSSTGNAFFAYNFDIDKSKNLYSNGRVSGTLNIRNVLFIKNNWNIDSLKKYFKRIDFYLGIGTGSGNSIGYGMLSNYVKLLR